MTTISLKLPEALLREITHQAEARRVGKSAIIRDCLEKSLLHGKKPPKAATCLDLMEKVVGSFHGPRDLSSNRGHLREALIKRATRTRKNSR